MKDHKNILRNFKNRWQLLLGFEVGAYALGISVLVYFMSFNLLFSCLGFVVIAFFAALIIKPWKPSIESTSSYIDQKLEMAEYSSGLLLKPTDQLSDLALLQQTRISEKLEKEKINLSPPNNISRAGIIATILILIGILGNQMNLFRSNQEISNPQTESNLVTFEPIDSTKVKIMAPRLESQSVTIRYPKYTNSQAFSDIDMNIKALEGSWAKWQIKFDSKVKQVALHSQGTDYPMVFNSGVYGGSSQLKNSGFYYFKFKDTLDNEYSSKLYSIEVTSDRSPEITISGIEQFTSFEFQESKKLQLITSISDDFGISKAHIIATVSKGSGESVKFREERMEFDTPLKQGNKSIDLLKTLDLDMLKMDPGDELYFYVESSDLKQPTANTSRSETYFAVIKDTTNYDFAVAGNLGVDRMPDYFRSQRQLIIDTKKLISERTNLTKDTFNYRSNELGFDQKALRLRYAEFMGEEEDSGLDIGNENLESLENEEQNEEEE
ncbi:MAG: tryptophan-rich sensory protein, partial [Flavobacteriaceae bacterium]|nr:tryptophan-rich sensory protein [Flavobacteriaceae bacterium]